MEVTHAISLTQPWATLLAIGSKRYETRSWRHHHRGWIAIHAAKSFPRSCRDLIAERFFGPMLFAAGIERWQDLPIGQVIGVGLLIDYAPTTSIAPYLEEMELAFGDYSIGRWAWRFDSARRVDPFPCKGALGVWQLPKPIVLP